MDNNESKENIKDQMNLLNNIQRPETSGTIGKQQLW